MILPQEGKRGKKGEKKKKGDGETGVVFRRIDPAIFHLPWKKGEEKRKKKKKGKEEEKRRIR